MTNINGQYGRLEALLHSDLDFHQRASQYATHTLHAFPAKFPPQLPRHFIEGLTQPQEVVLDPMAGSGTTLLEASLAGRRSLGLDIDPLALRIAQSKTQPVHSEQVLATLQRIHEAVQQALQTEDEAAFERAFAAAFDPETQRFIRYWYAPQTARALFYLSRAIQRIPERSLRLFFEVAFSAIIITKRGGVSLALDLAHTRPHRAKVVFDENGQTVLDNAASASPARLKVLTKRLRPVLVAFEQRVKSNLKRALALGQQPLAGAVAAGNARRLPLRAQSVDLIVTSPPYASNAIDYMRAHKFSLIWFGYPVGALSQHRKKYIGGESSLEAYARNLPAPVQSVLHALRARDEKKARAVHRYYTEMRDVLREAWRVLRPGKAAVFVVGTSIIRDVDIAIADCLLALGQEIGFQTPPPGIRTLDRNRRMMPVGHRRDATSRIQQRMHQEFVLGFYKPSLSPYLRPPRRNHRIPLSAH